VQESGETYIKRDRVYHNSGQKTGGKGREEDHIKGLPNTTNKQKSDEERHTIWVKGESRIGGHESWRKRVNHPP